MLRTLVLSRLLRLRRASLLAVTLAAAFACGEKFTGVAPATGGRTASGGAGENGAGEGGAGAASTDAGRAGKPSVSGGSGGKGGAAIAAGDAGRASVAGTPAEAGAGGQPTEVSPIPTDGLQLWLRADRGLSTLSTGVVQTWTDLSGHGRDATQSALNYSPRLVADALSGRPALVFDGTDDFLKLPALDVDFSDGVSIFIAMRQESTATCDPYFEASTDAEMNDLHFGDWKDSFNYEVEEDYLQDDRYSVLLHEPQIAVAVQAADGWAHLRRNGNGAGELKMRLPPPVVRTQVFIGRSLYADCARFDGSIGELLLYSRGLDDSEVLEVEGYLQQKWGCCAGDPP